MRPRVGLSLFWRTFFLLSLLLIGSIVAWLQTFRALEFEPRAVQTAQQIASLVNLSRAALVHSDSIARVSLIKTLADQEGVRILPREPTDKYATFSAGELDTRVMDELLTRLGPGTVMAASVNGEEGLWVGFKIDADPYWMLLDRARLTNVGGRTWLIWLITAAGLSLTGAALIARLINRPLKQLSFAASRVRDGDFDASRLDEKAVTSEIREVNIGFNRMAQQLAKIEQDRAVMLAGISHDLRTPLARLRLETEMSVADADAREHMAADIDQLDAIIDKFLDYARPDHAELKPVLLNDVIEACLYAVQDQGDMRVNLDVAKEPVRAGRRGGTRARHLQPAGERAALRQDPGDGHRDRRHRRQVAQRVGAAEGARPRHGRGARGPAQPDQAFLPRRRGPHRGHRRRPGPGHRRQDGAAHGRHLRAGQHQLGRAGGAHQAAKAEVADGAVRAAARSPRSNRRRRARATPAPAAPRPALRWPGPGPPAPASRPSWPSR